MKRNLLENSIKKKKIAYISDNQFMLDRSDAESEQVINTVSTLAAEGLNIELVIPRMWRNLGVAAESRKQAIGNYYRVANGFGLKELLHLPRMPLRLEKYSHALLASPYARLKHHDLIYTRHRASLLLALQLGLPVVFETYRIYARSPLNCAKKIAKLSHRRNLLGIITHSIPAKESLVQAGADENKIAVIHNGFNPALLAPRLSQQEARKQLGWTEDDQIVCYAGRLDKMKGLEMVLQMAARLPALKFYFIGKTVSDRADWITTAARRDQLKNVKQFPWAPVLELPKYLFASDVLLIPPSAKPMMQYGRTILPIKTFLYLSAGVPILAPDLPDTQGVLHEKNAALVPPDDVESASVALRKLFADRAWAHSIARQARLDSEKFTWQQRAKRIAEFLSQRLQEYEKVSAR
ncbi:MAG: glycosyltransferase [bacterium]